MGTGPDEKSWRERLTQPEILAHWQLVCHGMIFDISRTGTWLNPQLLYNEPTIVGDDERVEFYREKIGTTLLSCDEVKEIGE